MGAAGEWGVAGDWDGGVGGIGGGVGKWENDVVVGVDGIVATGGAGWRGDLVGGGDGKERKG